MGNPARKIEQITNWSAISVVFFIPKGVWISTVYNAILYSVHMPLFLLFVHYFFKNAIFMYIYVSYLTQKMIKNAIVFW
jgi:hypothetical protein